MARQNRRGPSWHTHGSVAKHDYEFTTHWRFDASSEEVWAVLADAQELPRWWPSVYLEAQRLENGDSDGVGQVTALWTKGFLPYTLRWRFRVSEVERPHRLAIEAVGDFVGRGLWTLAGTSDETNVTFDWRVRAEKPVLRGLSFLLKPVFSANHAWAMARGDESLRLELLRRRATTDEERARIPAPPQPTFPHNLRRRRA
jgi:Polyketide cyclase / dehydrase and lipid transport